MTGRKKDQMKWKYRIEDSRIVRVSGASGMEPLAIYKIDVQYHRRRKPRYSTAVLTEVGTASIGYAFRTLNAAQNYCAHDLKSWLGKKESIADLAREAAAA